MGDTEGGGLSGNESGAGCAWVRGVRRTYGGGMGGSSTGSPWNISIYIFFFFFLLSFFLSGWATDTLLCPCPFMQNLAHGGRVCVIRSQESMYGNGSGCPGVPVTT